MTEIPLIYILGVGRTGSTLVERMLASAPGAAAMGEAHALWRLPLAELTCSCGAPGPDCPVWSETRARAGLDEDGLARLAELERKAIRHKVIAASGFSVQSFGLRPEIQEFLNIQNLLFDAFAEVVGAALLIDSSKAPPRAWALAARPGVRILRLTRAADAIRASWAAGKHDPSRSGPMETRGGGRLARERLVEKLSSRLLARQTGLAELSYEDLVAGPRDALRDALGPGLTNAIAWRGDASVAPDQNYHSLLGNPDRFVHGEIEVRAPSPPARRAAA